MDMILKAETLPEDIAFFAKLLNVSVSDFNEYCILNLQKSNIFLVILQHLIDPEAQHNSRSSPLRQSDEAFFSQLPLSVVKRLYWKLRPVRRNCFQSVLVCAYCFFCLPVKDFEMFGYSPEEYYPLAIQDK